MGLFSGRALRAALLGAVLTGAPAFAQARTHHVEIGGVVDAIDHRDDNVSRLRYSGSLLGVGMGYRITSPASVWSAEGDIRAGELSADRGGQQELATASWAFTYQRRLRSVSVGAALVGSLTSLQHAYAVGITERFLSSEIGLRPEASFRVPRAGSTRMRVAATGVAWVLRPYSRSKNGNAGSLELAGPWRWRDATLSVERPLGEGGRVSHRYGYALRMLSFDAENGYAAVRNSLYFATAVRVRGGQ